MALLRAGRGRRPSAGLPRGSAARLGRLHALGRQAHHHQDDGDDDEEFDQGNAAAQG